MSVIAWTLALRGCWSMTDSSPKKSPGPRSASSSDPRRTLHRAVDDDVQAGSDLTLADDELAGGEILLAGRGGEARHRLVADAREKGHVLQRHGLLLGLTSTCSAR